MARFARKSRKKRQSKRNMSKRNKKGGRKTRKKRQSRRFRKNMKGGRKSRRKRQSRRRKRGGDLCYVKNYTETKSQWENRCKSNNCNKDFIWDPDKEYGKEGLKVKGACIINIWKTIAEKYNEELEEDENDDVILITP